MKGFILAAGLGQRLRPYTGVIPKPLFPVLGLPMLRWVLAGFSRAGVTDAVVNAYHLGGQIEQEVASGPSFGMRVVCSYEKRILGTGGGLVNAARLLNDEQGFLLHNGDIFSLRDPGSVVTGKGVPVLGLVDGPNLAENDRRVEIDGTGRVVSIRGLPRPGNGHRVVYGGLAWITPAVISKLREGMPGLPGEAVSQACLIADGLIPMISEGREVRYVCVNDNWYCDIGNPESYLALNRRTLAHASTLLDARGFEVPREVSADVFVAAGARVGTGVTFKGPVMVCAEAVIAPGAVVGPFVTVCGSVDKGAHVSDAVVMRGGVARGRTSGILMS